MVVSDVQFTQLLEISNVEREGDQPTKGRVVNVRQTNVIHDYIFVLVSSEPHVN